MQFRLSLKRTVVVTLLFLIAQLFSVQMVNVSANGSGSDLNTDFNRNQIDDAWERKYNLKGKHATRDADRDGLNNLQEFLVKTNPLVSDTDRDGITDGNEDADADRLKHVDEFRIKTDPLKYDSDEDGTTDGDEDFDNDRLTNMQEFYVKTNPLRQDSNNNKKTDADEDSDRDSLTNAQEFQLSEKSPSDFVNCLALEICPTELRSDPLQRDSDRNGVVDGNEDFDRDLLTNRQEYLIQDSSRVCKSRSDCFVFPSEPWDADVNLNGIRDGAEDIDNDKLLNYEEFLINTNPSLTDSNRNGVIDGNEDADRDRLTNAQEMYISEHHKPACLGTNCPTMSSHPLRADSDRDRVLDGDEDSDADGMSNRLEFDANKDPVRKDSAADSDNDRDDTREEPEKRYKDRDTFWHIDNFTTSMELVPDPSGSGYTLVMKATNNSGEDLQLDCSTLFNTIIMWDEQSNGYTYLKTNRFETSPGLFKNGETITETFPLDRIPSGKYAIWGIPNLMIENRYIGLMITVPSNYPLR